MENDPILRQPPQPTEEEEVNYVPKHRPPWRGNQETRYVPKHRPLLLRPNDQNMEEAKVVKHRPPLLRPNDQNMEEAKVVLKHRPPIRPHNNRPYGKAFEENEYYAEKQRQYSRRVLKIMYVPQSRQHHNQQHAEKQRQYSRRVLKIMYVPQRRQHHNQQRVDLPWDTLCNVWSKLPIKSIMRFRCVSKNFNRITEDPQFVNLQLNTALDQPSSFIVNEVFTFSGWKPMNSMYLVDKRRRKWKATRIPFTKKIKDKKWQIIGSCNGLLCLSKPSRPWNVVLYNPITQESFNLPPTTKDIFERYKSCSAFGFDAISNAYKVVSIFGGENGAEVYIINVGEPCWRKLNLPCEFRFISYVCSSKKAVFFNGAFYWIIQRKTASEVLVKKCILVLEIHSEKFEEIDFIVEPLMEEFFYLHEVSYYLVNFRKSLALMAYNTRNEEMQIWLLVDGSWIRESTHDMVSSLKHKINIGYEGLRCRVEGVVGDAGLLLDIFDENTSESDCHYRSPPGRHHLVLYNPVKRKFHLKILPSTALPRYFDVISFTPTLVSPS